MKWTKVQGNEETVRINGFPSGDLIQLCRLWVHNLGGNEVTVLPIFHAGFFQEFIPPDLITSSPVSVVNEKYLKLMKNYFPTEKHPADVLKNFVKKV